MLTVLLLFEKMEKEEIWMENNTVFIAALEGYLQSCGSMI